MRKTIVFYLPLSMDALLKTVETSSLLPRSFEATSGASGGLPNPGIEKSDLVYWDKKKLYVNPQSISISKNKIIKDALTKGGYTAQYWGEGLVDISVNGHTGSSGIEGINVLDKIYRHEQLHFPKIIQERDRRLAQEALNESIEASQNVDRSPGIAVLQAADAILTGGAIADAARGIKSTVDVFSDILTNGGSEYTPATIPAMPTLGAFATNVQIYYDGVFYRGYFTNFKFDESATEPGWFNYSFSFKCFKMNGIRKNFMPWHRNPLDASGETIISPGPYVEKGEFPGNSNLTFPVSERELKYTRGEQLEAFISNSNNGNIQTSIFKDEGVNRRSSLDRRKKTFGE